MGDNKSIYSLVSKHMPVDVIVTIICAIDDRNINELFNTLYSISLTCKHLNDIITQFHDRVIDHYTVESRVGEMLVYTLFGMLHRAYDLPAIVSPRKSEWYQFGKQHRADDQPAVVEANGSLTWYRHGIIHRENDQPAVIIYNILPSGEHSQEPKTMIWYQRGHIHRDNDKPAMIQTDSKSWFQYGMLHRSHNRPAIMYVNGNREWYCNNKRHRDNGPAVVCKNGTHQWYQYGKYISSIDPASV